MKAANRNRRGLKMLINIGEGIFFARYRRDTGHKPTSKLRNEAGLLDRIVKKIGKRGGKKDISGSKI